MRWYYAMAVVIAGGWFLIDGWSDHIPSIVVSACIAIAASFLTTEVIRIYEGWGIPKSRVAAIAFVVLIIVILASLNHWLTLPDRMLPLAFLIISPLIYAGMFLKRFWVGGRVAHISGKQIKQ